MKKRIGGLKAGSAVREPAADWVRSREKVTDQPFLATTIASTRFCRMMRIERTASSLPGTG